MPITFQKVAHTYNADSPFSYAALKGIDLEIPEGRYSHYREKTRVVG